MWVVRNIHGSLELSQDKPYRYGDDWVSSVWIGYLRYDLFPTLKWEDEPIEVELIAKTH